MSLFQPIGQKRLTNIAVVKYKKCGKRFEIACYKNKVLNWRNGIEKDLDEVLQTTAVFSNVSKGVLAKKEDLAAAFGTSDEEQICVLILREGLLQVSDKERKVELDSLFRDVASVLSEKCVNPTTGRPYTASMIERALRDAHFSVDPNKRAKQQALEALHLLQAQFPIQRARMRLKLTVPAGHASEELMGLLRKEGSGVVVESADLAAGGASVVTTCQVDPGMFRELNTLVQQAGGGGGGGGSGGSGARIEVLDLAVAGEEEEFDSLHAVPAAQSSASGVMIAGAPTAAASGGAAPAAGQQQQQRAAAASSSGYQLQASSGGAARHAGGAQRRATAAAVSSAVVVCARGRIQDIPEEHASRKERFEELDRLQAGWEVELRERGGGGVVDAVFFSPEGEEVGSYANARRIALAASKAAAAATAAGGGIGAGSAAAAAERGEVIAAQQLARMQV